ncbi:MAG: hypothetical protein QXL81_01295 [Candidatus Aenigmatarchaeota archaeon]
MLLLCVQSASAFEMVVSTDTLAVHTGEVKSIEVAVVSAADDIVVFASPIEQPWITQPTHLIVNASQEATAKITFSPFDKTEPKIYTFHLVLQSIRTGERRERNLTIIVHSAQVAIEKMEVSGALEPGGWGQLDVYVKNYEDSSASVKLDISVGGFLTYSDDFALGAGEFRVVKRGFTIPECQASGEYTAHADVQFQGKNVFSADEPFVIAEKFAPVIVKNETTSAFKAETSVAIKNIGNVGGTAEYTEQILGTLFFAGDKPTSTDGGFKWRIDLGACQAATIHYQIDYTPIPAALFVLLALWYIFFRMRTIGIRKIILQKARIEKGFEFTVGINVKSWVKAKDIEIRDFVPSLFEVRDTPGIKPIKRRSEAGTELIWRFKEFKPYEERILDYKIIPLFSISGNINLPRASVSFVHFGRRITKPSSPATLGMALPQQPERAASALEQAIERINRLVKKLLERAPKKQGT